MARVNPQFFNIGFASGQRAFEDVAQRKLLQQEQIREQESAKFLINILNEDVRDTENRIKGAQVLGQLRILADEPPAIRKANAPVLFQAFEKEFGSPIAKNLQDMIAKAPSEQITPILDEVISQYRQDPNANVEQLNQVLANPIAAVHQIGALNQRVNSQNELDAPKKQTKINPQQEKLNVLLKRRERLQRAAFSPMVTDRQKPVVFRMIEQLNTEIKEMQPSKKGDDKGAFGSSLTGLSQEMLVRNREILEGGGKLTPRQAMEDQFARSNLTTPRDIVQTDPVTGQKRIVTIRPQLPEGFRKPSKPIQPSQPPDRVIVKDLEPELSPKQLRVQAQQDVKAFSGALKKLKETVKFVQKNPDSVGIRGQATKVASAISGAVGGPVSVKRNVLESKLESLRSDLRSLVDKGKFSDQDRAILERIIGGTDILSTPEGTLASFQEAMRLIEGKVESAKQTLGKGREPQIKFRGFK